MEIGAEAQNSIQLMANIAPDLFISNGVDRIQSNRTSRGDVERDQRNDNQQRGHACERRRVAGRDTVEHSCSDASEREGSQQPQAEARNHDRQTPTTNHPDDVTRLSTERDSDTDSTCLSRYRERGDAV